MYLHIQQLHTFDIIFIELASIVFWFNPLMKYLKRSIQEIHEFIVDEKIAGVGQDRKDYAELLLNLASDYKRFNAFTYQRYNHFINVIYDFVKIYYSWFNDLLTRKCQ